MSAYDEEEQRIIDEITDLVADLLVTYTLKLIDTPGFADLTKLAGVQHQKQVHDRAIDELIDRLTNIRQGGGLEAPSESDT